MDWGKKTFRCCKILRFPEVIHWLSHPLQTVFTQYSSYKYSKKGMLQYESQGLDRWK